MQTYEPRNLHTHAEISPAPAHQKASSPRERRRCCWMEHWQHRRKEASHLQEGTQSAGGEGGEAGRAEGGFDRNHKPEGGTRHFRSTEGVPRYTKNLLNRTLSSRRATKELQRGNGEKKILAFVTTFGTPHNSFWTGYQPAHSLPGTYRTQMSQGGLRIATPLIQAFSFGASRSELCWHFFCLRAHVPNDAFRQTLGLPSSEPAAACWTGAARLGQDGHLHLEQCRVLG